MRAFVVAFAVWLLVLTTAIVVRYMLQSEHACAQVERTDNPVEIGIAWRSKA